MRIVNGRWSVALWSPEHFEHHQQQLLLHLGDQHHGSGPVLQDGDRQSQVQQQHGDRPSGRAAGRSSSAVSTAVCSWSSHQALLQLDYTVPTVIADEMSYMLWVFVKKRPSEPERLLQPELLLFQWLLHPTDHQSAQHRGHDAVSTPPFLSFTPVPSVGGRSGPFGFPEPNRDFKMIKHAVISRNIYRWKWYF